MKKAALVFFTGLLYLSATAQTQLSSYHYTEEFYFVKEIPVTAYQGKNFRYEIAVRADASDTLSRVRIHGIAAGAGKDDFINSNYKVESRQEQDWIIYTVIGSIQPHAKRLWFYAAVNGNGRFYFDDISFYVEEQKGHWKQLQISNPSFEENKADIFSGYYVSTRRSSTVQTSLSQQVFKTGQQALLVQTSNATPVSQRQPTTAFTKYQDEKE
ncbi:MAG: hypothetical protein QM731_20275 [Chitinophagaceae bacterium]